MKIHLFKRLAKYSLNFLFSLLISSYSLAQERWFQIELSIFSNENIEDRNAESWLPSDYELNYPKNMRKLSLLTDLFLSDHNLDDRLSVTGTASQEEIDEMIKKDQLKNIRPWIKNSKAISSYLILAGMTLPSYLPATVIFNRQIEHLNAHLITDYSTMDFGDKPCDKAQMRYRFILRVG